MTRKLYVLASLLAFSLLFLNNPIYAAGGSSNDSKPQSRMSASFRNGKSAIEAKQFDAAIQHLLKAANETPKNADVYNLLGYSYRKLGKFDQSLDYYNQALSLKPSHLGANEYIGELYLQTNNLAAAEKHLKILDNACLFGCEEYDDLKEAIAKYKAENNIQ